jgi:hypothetical protein
MIKFYLLLSTLLILLVPVCYYTKMGISTISLGQWRLARKINFLTRYNLILYPSTIAIQNKSREKFALLKSTLFFVAFLFTTMEFSAQSIDFTGAVIYPGGAQSTEIGIANSHPEAFYKLISNRERTIIRPINPGSTPNPNAFGEYSHPYSYAVVQFNDPTRDTNPHHGIPICSQVRLKPVPELSMPMVSVHIKSGDYFECYPKADITDASYFCTATVNNFDKSEEFDNLSNGPFILTKKLADDNPVIVSFSNIPISSASSDECLGATIDSFIFEES